MLKPAAIALCMRSGAPGGLFTPSLTVGAMLGGVLGYAWSWCWPGVPPGLFAVIGAGAVLAATTQGPILTVVLIMELTGHYRSFILPLLLAVSLATMVARTIEPRSIYDARLRDEEVRRGENCSRCRPYDRLRATGRNRAGAILNSGRRKRNRGWMRPTVG